MSAFRMLQRIFNRATAWRPGQYLRASWDLFGWLALRAIVMVGQILLLTHSLGAEGYGIFVANLAICSFIAPLAGWGMQGTLLLRGAQQPAQFNELLGSVISLWRSSVFFFSAVTTAALLLTAPSHFPALLLALFASSEIASSSLNEIASRAEQSQHNTRAYGILLAGLPSARLIGATICFITDTLSVQNWLAMYGITGLLYTLGTLHWLTYRYNPKKSSAYSWRLIRDSLPFAATTVSIKIQSEFNKPVLAQINLAQTGNFSAAQRVIDLTSLPLIALQEALWPKLYSAKKSKRQLLWIRTALLTCSIVLGLLITSCAPLIPWLLGAEFMQTAHIARALAWLPAIQMIKNLLTADATANQKQRIFLPVYAFATVALPTMTTILIVNWGLSGAVTSVYAGEATLVILLLITYRYWNVKAVAAA